MRAFLTLLLLILSASPIRAQSSGEVAAVPEITVPAEPAAPAPSGDVQPETLQDPSAPAERETDPILDAGFWRSVLAGVIVTVVSALILRAIL